MELGDPTQRYLVQYTFEQHPGVTESIDSRVPRTDAISGLPVHLEFRTCHFIFAQPHTTVALSPIVVHGYAGDWHVGVDLYKEWRATWFKPTHLPAWVQEVHSWLQLQGSIPRRRSSRVPYA